VSAVTPGRVIDGRYRVRREIARGGMAIVYEADHIHLGRRVALKMTAPEIAAMPVARARGSRARLHGGLEIARWIRMATRTRRCLR